MTDYNHMKIEFHESAPQERYGFTKKELVIIIKRCAHPFWGTNVIGNNGKECGDCYFFSNSKCNFDPEDFAAKIIANKREELKETGIVI